MPPRRKAGTDPDPATARDRALRLLTRREHSARDLKRKLKERGFDDEAADHAIGALAGDGLQSNARFAEQLIRTRITQGCGPMRIEADLRQAGLAGDEIDAAMAATECDWAARAIEVHARKFGSAPRSMAERNRHYRFLMSRGFTGDQIRAALKQDLAED